MAVKHIKIRGNTTDPPSTFEQKSELENGSEISRREPIPPDKFPDVRTSVNGHCSIHTTIENLKFMIDEYRITVMFDNFSKKEIINIPGLECAPETAETTALTQIISLASLHGLNVSLVPDFVSAIASERQFNGPLSWIRSKPWDGISRLESFYETLKIPTSFSMRLRNCLIYRWLLSVTAAAYLPRGFRSRGVLALQGPQGIGKTTWVLNLICNKEMRAKYIKTGHHLDAGNKDSMLGAISHWIVELGELDSTFKKDAARLKGFLTEDFDKVRIPYAKRESYFPRRTVFCASVNETTFLVDPTGNTRFWTIPIVAINYDHGIDTQQLFAEALSIVQNREQWWLTSEEDALLEDANKEFRSVNAIRDMIYEALEFELPKDRWKRMSAIEILKSLDIDKPSNTQCKDAASTLRELEPKIGPATRSQGKTRWLVPITNFNNSFGGNR